MLDRVAAHMARYLARNMGGDADTVEGVHAFWIGAQCAQESLDVTQAALEYLLEQGAIMNVPVGNRMLWRAIRQSDRAGP